MDRGWGRVDVGEQVGRSRLTGFADVDPVAGPLGVAFVTVARVGIVRRFDPLGGRRSFTIRLEADAVSWASPGARPLVHCPVVVALPRPTQGRNDRQFPCLLRGFGSL